MTTVHRPSATIVAFDGLVADTLAARALAVSDAVTAEVSPCSLDEGLSLVQGRSLDEAVEAALVAGADTAAVEFDATLRDLAVLRARRSYTAMVAQGLPLRDGAADWIALRAASHGRVILRADSARRDVERIIAFTGLQDVVAFVRCADDLPRTLGASSPECAWAAITSRLAAQRVALEQCVALECSAASAAVARKYLSDVSIIQTLT